MRTTNVAADPTARPSRRAAGMRQSVTRAAWRLLAARRGNAAVEFALLTPVLLGLTIPIADLGLLAYDQMQVQLAAQAGAEYAARHGWNPTGIQNAVTSATPSLTVTVGPQPFDPANVQFCGCASGTTISPLACTTNNTRSTCPAVGGFPPQLVGIYVGITASAQYTTILNYPLVPSPQTLKSTAVVRIQ